MAPFFSEFRLILLQSEFFPPNEKNICEKIINDVIIWYIIAGDRKMAHKISILPIKSVGLAPLSLLSRTLQ